MERYTLIVDLKNHFSCCAENEFSGGQSGSPEPQGRVRRWWQRLGDTDRYIQTCKFLQAEATDH